jgi:tRNA-specific 2-thiouridylase
MVKGRVLVAMSGGVDSSVAALLLKEQGYEVVGATLNLWSYDGREEPYNGCCSLEVKLIAQQLGIEHHFVDEGRTFKERVIEPFVAEYLAGYTPSPCGRCNRWVRFPKLLELADRLECDYLATGHHARIRCEDGVYYLLQGRDPLKDQSYFLYGLTQEQLARLLFPIGEYEKREVWEIAKEHGLVSARKPESQDLCFLPGGDRRGFLKAQANGQLKPGEIVDLEGRVLGRHEGLAFYTVGQRRGLGIAAGQKLYVVALDPLNNRVIVGPEEALYAEGLIAEDVHFIYEPEELKREGSARVKVKIRYRSPFVLATLERMTPGRVQVCFDEPQRAVAPGQLAVFYQGEKVLGGGTIAQALTRACTSAVTAAEFHSEPALTGR